jgi:hypothetical protein
MVKQHQKVVKPKAYSMGKLANVIWGEDWDAKYFVNNSTKISFVKVFHNMYEPNLEAQKIVQRVMHALMGPPYNWTTPNECYQRQP